LRRRQAGHCFLPELLCASFAGIFPSPTFAQLEDVKQLSQLAKPLPEYGRRRQISQGQRRLAALNSSFYIVANEPLWMCLDHLVGKDKGLIEVTALVVKVD